MVDSSLLLPGVPQVLLDRADTGGLSVAAALAAGCVKGGISDPTAGSCKTCGQVARCRAQDLGSYGIIINHVKLLLKISHKMWEYPIIYIPLLSRIICGP